MEKLDFSRCVPAADASSLDKRLLVLLATIADVFGVLHISSAFRTREHELSRGRKGDSSHCKGLAVDVFVKDGCERHRLLYVALMAGVPRIGIGKNFVHLDLDLSKPYPTCWTYYE